MPSDPFEAIARDLARLRRQVDDLRSIEVPGRVTGYVTTSDATAANLGVFEAPASTTLLIVANIVARRTGGAAGAAEDGAAYIRFATVKNVAGVATLIGAGTAAYTAEDQAAWVATIDVTGSTWRVRVAGAANNDISWILVAEVIRVSS